ncbi:hypothetical protein DFH09DRAFT_1087603 [Mycena vulgaris]|nr:hypothetical protein DFH09DRAFT_1087603 [Mycena vulgaris]
MTLPSFGFSTTADEIATVFAKEIRGKNVITTGTSLNSVEFETARAIARHANLVVIAGYDVGRLALSEAAIKNEIPTANIRCLSLDLSSLAGVRKAAGEVNAYSEPIHLTADNLESQIATDFIGPFLFTKLIAGKLITTKTTAYTPRVISPTSIYHEYALGIDLVDIERPDPAKYESFPAYNQAKSAIILFAAELSRRSGGVINGYSVASRLNSLSAAFTNILQKPESFELFVSKAFQFHGYPGIMISDGKPNPVKFNWKTIPQSAATTLVAAFDPRLDGKIPVLLRCDN